MSDLVKAADPALDKELSASSTPRSPPWRRCKARAEAGEAYDQQIGEGNAEGNAAVQAAIDALVDQTQSIERAVAALKLDAHRLRRLRQPRRAGQGLSVEPARRAVDSGWAARRTASPSAIQRFEC